MTSKSAFEISSDQKVHLGSAATKIGKFSWPDIKSLVKQGDLLELAKCQGTDLTWKSFIFNLKKGTLKFILNATIDTLPTNANLKQWGKSPTDKCPLPGCGVRQTLAHLLSSCKVSLRQDRYTFRHDGIVQYIAQCLDKSRFEVYADIEGHKTPDGRTIPASICLTLDRPDIVIIDRRTGNLYIWELTSCFDRDENFTNAHTNKENKYAYFLRDITELKPHVTAFEVGARGIITRENNDRLKALHKFCRKNIKLKQFIQNISALAVNASFYIFICRKDPVWSAPPLLSAPFTT